RPGSGGRPAREGGGPRGGPGGLGGGAGGGPGPGPTPPRAHPRSGMVQSIGSCPCRATASLICVNGREPKNFFADSGEGCAPLTTTCRPSSINGSLFCA